MARTFNGTSDYGSVALDLSAYSKITLAVWLQWDAFSNNDDLLMEYSPNANNANAFFIDPNDSGGVFGFFLKQNGLAGVNSAFATRPSAGVPHHYLITFDRNGTSAQQIQAYIDGVNWNITQVGTAAVSGNFDNTTLYLMSRAGSNLFGAGRIADLAIWGGVLGIEDDAAALASGRVFPIDLYRENRVGDWALCGVDNPEPDRSRNTTDMTIVGTTRSRHPVNNPACFVSASSVPLSAFE